MPDAPVTKLNRPIPVRPPSTKPLRLKEEDVDNGSDLNRPDYNATLDEDDLEADDSESGINDRFLVEEQQDEGERKKEEALDELKRQQQREDIQNKQEEPAQKREKLEEPRSPLKEKSGGAAGQAQTGVKAGETAANAAGAAGRTAATEAVGTAATGVAGAGAATGAAATAVGVEAGGAAVVGSTFPIWGTIAIIIGIILLIAGIIALVYSFRTTDRGQNGGTSPQELTSKDLVSPYYKSVLANLLALTGDETARQELTAEKIKDIDDWLDQAQKYADNTSYTTEIKAVISNAKNFATQLKIGATAENKAGASHRVDLTNKLFYALDRIVALSLGINLRQAKDIADSAQTVVSDNQNNHNWIYSGNQRPSDTSMPMRDGSNTAKTGANNGKRGCDPAGFVTYVLKKGNAQGGILNVSPGYSSLPQQFSSVLQSVNSSQDSSVIDTIQTGDIVLTQRGSAPNKEYDAYIAISTDSFAHCRAPDGPVSDNKSILNNQNITTILRFRYDNSNIP